MANPLIINCVISATGTGAIGFDASGNVDIEFCIVSGTTSDIQAETGSTASIYACQYDTTSGSGTVEVRWGDRSAWDDTNYAARHAKDISDAAYTYHVSAADRAAFHAAVTLASDADTLLGLTGQQLTLDNQNANKVLAGPTTGSPADPTFRSIVAADLPSLNGLDTTAVHTNVAAEIHGITHKSSPVSGDVLLIEDSAASFGKKYVLVSDLPTGMTNPMTTQDDIIVGGSSGAPGRLAKGSDSQVLTVNPSTHHVDWETPSSGFSDPTTTKGDLIVHGSSTTRLAVGTNNQVLTADSTQAEGIKWADPSGGASTPAALYVYMAGSFR